MAEVILKDITKIYDGGVKAVDKVNIDIKDREFVILVGPSGCGKSTTLRMVAGLEDISGGDLLIDGEIMNDVAPKDRNIAMVFQNYALYPHMTVYDNMAFGLKIRKQPKDEINRAVHEAAKILDIEELLDRKPKALSGGQRQRVAVGRAIVRDPKVFLFDEPLSNLDAKLRGQMRVEISSLHTRLQATMIYVTHDQTEAMTMGDKIVVMKGGVIQQIGSPLHLYNRPINRFVAGFIGSPPMNLVTMNITEKNGGLVAQDKEDGASLVFKVPSELADSLKAYVGKEILFGIRPEDVIYTTKPEADNNIEAKVEVIEPLGSETNLYINPGHHQLIVRTEPIHTFEVGDTVNFSIKPEKVHFFDIDTEKSIFYTEA